MHFPLNSVCALFKQCFHYTYGAGYAAGEATLPNPPTTSNVKDFGAVGDGVTDDTTAFMSAIMNGGVIYIPPGTYQ